MSTAPQRPKIGVGVFVLNKSGEFIVGLRKGSHGSGTWALPGGHLEFGEKLEECAAREVLEETDLDISQSDIRFLTATNSVWKDEGLHYVTVFMTAVVSGDKIEPKIMEPEKCDAWKWIKYEELKSWADDPQRKLFLPMLDLFATRPDISPAQNLA
ncbi:7,8-dihydro-8-oxoguanine triphosphatase NUDT15 [Phyllosticta capitalensis]|uniref:7,8-dihydro-8-oxoguanine triphosphatase NUDT15 n=1 Tax=Phyllosticta capitalensis TaxID=121624 RepID=A0ABR1Z0H8_9PEZI